MFLRLVAFTLAAVALWAGPVPSLTLKTVERTAVKRALSRVGRPVEFWLGPIAESERSREFVSKPGVLRAGVHRLGGDEFLSRGKWTEMPDGRAIFQASMRAPGATGLRLEFIDFAAGAGRVWLYPGDEPNPTQPLGPYEGGETFWSEFVEGESVVLEFEAPAGAPRMLPFRLGRISHIDVKISPAARAAALSCNLDVTCYPEWAERARSVGRYLFETSAGGALCSGALVNTRNSSGIPYFLTADHCVSNATEARSVQVFWFYQSSVCNGAPRSLRDVPTTSGSTYLAGGSMEQGDFTLLRLNGALPNGVTFSGWQPEELPMGTEVTGIHHPTGDYKRISFGNRAQPIISRGRPEANFHTITWRQGVTEGGSSGSPIFTNEGLIVGMLSGGPKPPAGQTECDLRPAYDFYGKFSSAYPALQSFLEERTTGGPPPTPPVTPPSGGTTLTSNTPVNFTAGPVTGPTLLNTVYRIDVPQGATRLEVRLRTATPSVDVDLFVRSGSAPALEGQRVSSDFSSTTDSGDETIVITPTSSPALRAGTYFIALALFTPNIEARGTLTAIVTGGGSPTPPPTGSGPVALTSGQTRTITLEPTESGTLYTGTSAYRIEVPQGATRLEIRLETDVRTVDVDLFARFNTEAAVVNRAVVADHRSDGPDGNEVITITPASSPALRPGTYFINLAVFSPNVRITSRLTATVTGGSTPTPPPSGGARTLTSGAPTPFTLEPVTSATLFTGDSAYQIAVPAGATRLEVRVRTTTPGADVDLYVRAAEVPRVANGTVQADFSSEGDTGEETIVITPTSTPTLRAGNYFIALGLFTTGVRVTGTVQATVTTSGASNTVAQPLIAGLPQRFSIAPVSSATLIADPSFRITVPTTAARVRVVLQTTTPNVDVDLFGRIGQAPNVTGGQIAADYRSEGPAGDESLDLRPTSSPALRPGELFLSLAAFSTGVRIEGSIVVYIDTTAAPPAAAVDLTSGVASRFVLPATATPTLYAGQSGFRIQVPTGATSLTVRLNTTTPNADVDLYVRRTDDVDLIDGEVAADFYSEGPTGNETLTITRTSTPPLEPGTYFIALGNFARNVEVTGVVTATIERSTAPPPTNSSTLRFSQPTPWRFDAVSVPTLLSGANAYRLDVTNVSRMEIELTTDTPGADVDLYVRFGSPPEIRNGSVVADFSSTGLTGNERITIAPGANSPLRSGTYWVAMAVFSTGVATSGTLEARDLSGGSSDAPKRRRPFGEKPVEPDMLLKSTLAQGDLQPLKAKAAPMVEQR